ncbi:uncharacterized protein LOC110235018 [Exaiptasia diaphana]|uniref:Uncharacterized protein n=1 Tax=Exaiptasia diaphana TaxID=2652724 RepID=A0A913WYH4_EXADI|nr:uncharacterized protein LOC110235018 [Exaiptasia diaphana]XP_020896092.1 uncharacterized protein LOC110235018 [Exaiptasia diaphana]KXJ27599.1 hypothetical protein AC249_AIPGENE7604 [Exaiptasia diaphana]
MSTDDAWYMAEKLRQVLQSKNFTKDDFDTRALKLSQAFCLLWQDKETGEVSGRQKPGRVSNAAVVAVLIDLFILGKIEFEVLVKQWTSMNRRREIIFVKVCDTVPTETFLDKALFSSMLSHHNSKPNEPKTATEWIIQGSGLSPTSATVVLDSLVDNGTLGKTSVMFWKKYPTLNQEPELNLIKEIRRTFLDGHVADGYMWTLIKLLCCVDNYKKEIGSILSRHFTLEELAKPLPEGIAALIRGDDDRCVDVLRVNGEFHELQDLGGGVRQQDHKVQDQQQITYAAPEGVSCAVHDVDLIVRDGSNSSTDEPENSQLLQSKDKAGGDFMKKS